MSCRAALAAALLLSGRPVVAQDAPLPSSTVQARDARGTWPDIWVSARAPVAWTSAPLSAMTRWQPGAAGVEWGEIALRGSGEAWRTRLVVARVDPSRVRFALDTAFTPQRAAAWTLTRAPATAVLA